MYNELISLPSLLRHIQTYSSQGHEIIIIDDGSTDGSDKYLTKQDFIKLLRFDKNLGKGLAIKSGIENSSNQKIIIFDGDLEIHPNQIKKLMILDFGNDTRCVFANRISNNKHLLWDTGNKILTKLFNFVHSSDIEDALCCAKAFFKSDIATQNLKSSKFDIDVELLSILVKSNPNTKNIGITYERRNKNQGKKLKFADSFRIFYRIIFS